MSCQKMKHQMPCKSVDVKEYGLVIVEHSPQSTEAVSALSVLILAERKNLEPSVKH
jgi:hypothetical protein